MCYEKRLNNKSFCRAGARKVAKVKYLQNLGVFDVFFINCLNEQLKIERNDSNNQTCDYELGPLFEDL